MKFALIVSISIIISHLSQLSLCFVDLDAIVNPHRGNGTASGRLLKPLANAYVKRPSLINIVKFANDECVDLSNQSGTCYTAAECKLKGGHPTSPCASGFGACCIVSRSCHNRTSERVVYFKNPSYPAADDAQNFCDLTVEVVDPDVCQLRLDFLDFQLDPPSRGDCRGDRLTISSSGMSPVGVPKLCGMNRNQHIYVSLPRESSAVRSASLVFETDSVGEYRWHVKVTQIDCSYYRKQSLLSEVLPNMRQERLMGFSTALKNPFHSINNLQQKLSYQINSLNQQMHTYTPQQLIANLYGSLVGFHSNSLPAPHGCLQYFTSASGIIESFNFGEYYNNLDYAICIERQPSTCRVVFSATDYDWAIDLTPHSGSINKAIAGVGDVDCQNDYLVIPAASRDGDGYTYDRYCGDKLSHLRGSQIEAPVVSKATGPIVLRFHTDGNHSPDLRDGFRLRYEQSSTDCLQSIVSSQSSYFSGGNGLYPPPVASLNSGSLTLPVPQGSMNMIQQRTPSQANPEDSPIQWDSQIESTAVDPNSRFGGRRSGRENHKRLII